MNELIDNILEDDDFIYNLEIPYKSDFLTLAQEEDGEERKRLIELYEEYKNENN